MTQKIMRISIRLAILLSIFFLGNDCLLAQTTYYVSSGGNDSQTGTSVSTAWKTLAKINSTTLVNGDIVLLKRGDTFTGQLKIKNSGITVDAYGSGNKPVISGKEQVASTWTVYSGNIWQTTFASNKPADIRGLYKEETPLPISRYPNKNINNGYLNFESHSGINQFTDMELSGAPSWTGADILVRCERFRLIKTRVSAHSGTSITIPSLITIDQLRDGYGYFFVNNINAIDLDNEWAYQNSSGKIFLYSNSDPGSTISFLRTDTTVSVENASNVNIKNLSIQYARIIGLSIKNGSSVLVDGVEVSHSGADGVAFSAVTNSTFSNSSITNVNWSGLTTNPTCNQLTITNNVIAHVGNEAFGKSKTFIAIDCNSPDCRIENNRISKTGYSGIISAGLNNLVKRNVIDSICLYLEDNGGIYTNGNIGVTTGTVIEENIITNSVGERLGAPAATSLANGIYLDNYSQGITVKNNTVAFVNGEGYFIGSVQTGIEILNNTSFQSGLNELQIYHPLTAPGFLIKGNILVTNSLSADHEVFKTISTDEYTYEQLGIFKDNFIINPFNDKAISFNYKADDVPRTQLYSPFEWEASVAQVSGTVPAIKKYPTGTIPDDVIKFYYNTTNTAQTYTLPAGLFSSVTNQAYCGSITLPAYNSLVLFKVGSGSCTSPGTCDAPSGLNIGVVTDSTAVLHWSTISIINSDVRYRPVGDTTWKYAYNVQADSVKLINLTGETDYECAVRNSCYGTESSWLNYDGFSTLISPPKPYTFKFVNATYSNCSPTTAFATIESTTDHKWTLVNTGGTGTVDKDFMRSNAGTEDVPAITMTVDSVLDKCNTYDVYLYYLSPTTQVWKTRARLADSTTFKLFDRNTVGAELLPDYTGTTTSNRLFRAKLGRVNGTTGFSVVLDDAYYGVGSKSIFDGLGYIQVSDEHPVAPDSLVALSVTTGTVNLHWQDLSSDETSFIIERKSGASSFAMLASLPSNTTSYTDTTITGTGNYVYRVYAQRGDCKSHSSNQLKVNYEKDLKVGHVNLPKPSSLAEAKRFIKFYPNPIEKELNISFTGKPAAHRFRLLNISGSVMVKKEFSPAETNPIIDCSRFHPGIYIAEVTNLSTNEVLRFKLLMSGR